MTDHEKFTQAIDGLTAAKFARIAGISAASVAVYKSGKQKIPAEILKIAMQIEDFFDSLMYQSYDEQNFKCVIDGKIYNTKTAQKLGDYWNGEPRHTDKYIRERLYKSPKGQYFIFKSNGAFCDSSNPKYNSGNSIYIIQESGAKLWLEMHCGTIEYTAAFGAVEG